MEANADKLSLKELAKDVGAAQKVVRAYLDKLAATQQPKKGGTPQIKVATPPTNNGSTVMTESAAVGSDDFNKLAPNVAFKENPKYKNCIHDCNS